MSDAKVKAQLQQAILYALFERFAIRRIQVRSVLPNIYQWNLWIVYVFAAI